MHTCFKQLTSILILFSLILPLASFPAPTNIALGADEAAVEQLRQNIATKNAQIEAINREIKFLDSQIQTTAAQGQSLKGAISTLEGSRAKLLKEIEATQGKVAAANLTIEQLGIEIKNKEQMIVDSKRALADALKQMNQNENISLAESVLAHNRVSEIWNEIERLTRFQTGVQAAMVEIEDHKIELTQKKSQNEAQKQNLIGFKTELEDKKEIVEINKTEKSKLLSQTQSKEAEYKRQLAEKKRLADAFQAEINSYEQELKLIIDPTSYPSSGAGILKWPLANVRITQEFGDTAFSRTTNAYKGKGHNGVDFAASVGTNVMSALDGTVMGTGNTDAVPGCYSYGKWVMIKHDNGLATLYAHLSLIKVTQGQRVKTGEVIGYSGNTGYSTGPHLHFGVYASQGVKIVQYTNSINCKNAIIPVADIRAYLNPLVYL